MTARKPTAELLEETDVVRLIYRVDVSPANAPAIEELLADVADKLGGRVGRNELGNDGTRILRRVKIR